MKKRIRVFLHRSKESNWDLCDFYQNDDLKYLGYEIECYFEIDTEAGDAKLIGADGRYLSDEAALSPWDWDEESPPKAPAESEGV